MNLKIMLISVLIFFSTIFYGTTEKIRFSFDNREIIVTLEDNVATRSFLKQLPLELRFENYGNIEKISYLPEKLDIDNIPEGSIPRSGDLTYYSPWNNLAFFCKDFRYSNGLVPLGRIESGFNTLEEINKTVSVKIERIN